MTSVKSALSPSLTGGSSHGGGSGSGDQQLRDLEEEVYKSRMERQNRRNTARGLGEQEQAGRRSPDKGQSTDEAGDKEATMRRLMGNKSDSTPASPAKRGAALLARYGGEAGPTGTANPGAGGGNSVSLASFMGGKASGPRLGKLAGDGRSAPPEAGLIDESRSRQGVALPGLASPSSQHGSGNKSLASFLEARATGRETATSPLPSSPARSTSPTRSTSPVRRAPSPVRATPASQEAFKAPASPTKRSTSPFKQPASQTSSSLAPTSRPGLERNSSSFTMRNMATSPIRPDDIQASDAKTITPTASSSSKTQVSSGFQPPKVESSVGPAFAATRQSDKQPTASLTRLQGSGMVEQRLREAKRREAASSSTSSSPVKASPVRSSTADVSSRWGATGSSSPSKVESPGKKWSRTGNALPGLSQQATAERSQSLPSPTKVNEPPADDRYDVAPVRLPGMGGVKSPFGASGGRACPQKEQTDFFGSQDAESKPLSSLTAGRARGPARKTPRTAAAATPEPAVTPVASSGAAAAPSQAPLRSTSGKRIVVLISGSGSNLQALIDATQVSPAGPLSDAQISFVLSNRKAAFGLQRAANSNPPIATKVLALKTWQNRNEGGTREQYDEVLAKAVLDAELPEDAGQQSPPDLIVLAGFMHIVSPQFLRALGHVTELPESEAPSWRPNAPVPIINLHPALPGAFDGANAIPRALEAFQKGEVDRTGVMVHEVVAEVDRGAPIVIEEIPISQGETLEELETRMHQVEHRLIVEGARRVLDTSQPVGHLAAPSSAQAVTSPGTRAREDRFLEQQNASLNAFLEGTPAPFLDFPPASRGARLDLPDKVTSLPALNQQHKSSLQGLPRSQTQRSSFKTVSIEVLSILNDGSTATIPLDQGHILYESETLAIIHRFKTSSSKEEVSTQVFARIGCFSRALTDANCKEVSKLDELAAKFKTKLIDARQGKEPIELARICPSLKLETRQGLRKSWDKGDSLMWRISSLPDGPSSTVFFADQVDLQTSNLCSASSYIVSVVGNVFAWHGKGATTTERAAALVHARSVFGSKISISEQEEGSESSSFWSMLDKKQAYANAWHHRRRANLPSVELIPRLFTIASMGKSMTIWEHQDSTFTSSDIPMDGVSVLCLPLEIYILVGPEARSKRKEIAFAMSSAAHLGQIITSRRTKDESAPSLPIHVVISPSEMPLDLTMSLRYWDRYAEELTRGSKTMNVIGWKQAERELLGDVQSRDLERREELPLGVGEEDLLSL